MTNLITSLNFDKTTKKLNLKTNTGTTSTTLPNSFNGKKSCFLANRK